MSALTRERALYAAAVMRVLRAPNMTDAEREAALDDLDRKAAA